MTKLILIRHGQTDWNRRHTVQGVTNTPLNRMGVAQAQDLRRQIAELQFDLCYSSPMLRAAQTAMTVVDGRTEIIYDSRLRERGFGKFEGMYLPKWELIKPNIFDRNINTNVRGIEPICTVDTRTGEFLREIGAKHGQDTTLLIISHAGTLKSLLAHFIDWTSPEFQNFRFVQGQVYQLEF